MTTDEPRGDLLMRVGAWITVAGLAFTAVAMLPLLIPSMPSPPWLWFLAMLTGVGLIIVLIGLVRSSRGRRRRRSARP